MLGVRSPLGWLCISIIRAELDKIVLLKMFWMGTIAVLISPILTMLKLIGLFFVSRFTTQTYSRSIWARTSDITSAARTSLVISFEL